MASAIAKSLGESPNVYGRNQLFKFPNQSKLRAFRVQNLLNGEFTDHVVTAWFDVGATKITLRLPPTPDIVLRKAANAGGAKVPLAPWPDQEAPIPGDWAMSSLPLETLR